MLFTTCPANLSNISSLNKPNVVDGITITMAGVSIQEKMRKCRIDQREFFYPVDLSDGVKTCTVPPVRFLGEEQK